MSIRIGDVEARFRVAKTPFAIALAVAVLVWLTGFMAIGGEWFQMRRLPGYGGQQAAFMFYMTFLLSGVCIFQTREDREHTEDQ